MATFSALRESIAQQAEHALSIATQTAGCAVQWRAIAAAWQEATGEPCPYDRVQPWWWIFEPSLLAGRVVKEKRGARVYYHPAGGAPLPIPAPARFTSSASASAPWRKAHCVPHSTRPAPRSHGSRRRSSGQSVRSPLPRIVAKTGPGPSPQLSRLDVSSPQSGVPPSSIGSATTRWLFRSGRPGRESRGRTWPSGSTGSPARWSARFPRRGRWYAPTP